VTFQPAADSSIDFAIQTSVSDGTNAPVDGSKPVTGLAVNDAPTLDPIAMPDPVVAGSGMHTIPLSGIGAGPGEAGQSLTVTAVSDNPALVPDPAVTYSSPATSGSLAFTPTAAGSGSATISVTVQDDGGTANGGLDSRVRQVVISVLSSTVFADGFE
jgi:hypothetical protein